MFDKAFLQVHLVVPYLKLEKGKDKEEKKRTKKKKDRKKKEQQEKEIERKY